VAKDSVSKETAVLNATAVRNKTAVPDKRAVLDEAVPGVSGGDETVQVDVLRALAHPVRWGILQRLAADPGICACDFTEFFRVSQPTISAHLKALREAGLVTTQRRGTTICYSLAPARLESLAQELAGLAATAPAPATT
jgi:ArsR family transcriptional regulator, arsenate/arsenite/antimonite-responsive transcriptional repressor